MSRPPASRSPAHEAGTASSPLWRILFGVLAVVITALRSRGSGQTPLRGAAQADDRGPTDAVSRRTADRPARDGAGRSARSPQGPQARKASEPGRGRGADSPTEIPVKGLLGFISAN